MRFSLEARGCQTHVWSLCYLHWVDRHRVEEMNNKHRVLWGPAKENNKLASVRFQERMGFFRLLSKYRVMQAGSRAGPEETSNFLRCLHPVGKPRLATREAAANLIRMFCCDFWCGFVSGLRRKKGLLRMLQFQLKLFLWASLLLI